MSVLNHALLSPGSWIADFFYQQSSVACSDMGILKFCSFDLMIPAIMPLPTVGMTWFVMMHDEITLKWCALSCLEECFGFASDCIFRRHRGWYVLCLLSAV